MSAFIDLYDKLFSFYGPQSWWPAENEFEMMIGAILVQNTSWTNVDKAMNQLRPHLDAPEIDAMPEAQLAELIRPSGFYNIKTKRVKSFVKWFMAHGCDVEKLKTMKKMELREELLAIHGIGRETADDILLYAFDMPVFIVDAYARRIFYRVGFDMPAAYDDFRIRVEEELPDDLNLYNEFHAVLVEHAKVHCRMRPICEACPLLVICDQRIE